MVAELKTAAEVRAHARKVAARMRAQLGQGPPAKAAPRPAQPPAPPNIRAPIIVVMLAAANHHGILLGTLLGRARATHEIVGARHVGFFVCKRLLGWSTVEQIGAVASHRNWSTIAQAIKGIKGRIDRGDRDIIAAVNAVGTRAARDLNIDWASVP
jgi:hypothetical protein